MTETNQDFTMWAGDSKILEITVTDCDGNAKNITGATIEWALAATDSFGNPYGTALIEKSTATPGEVDITDGANGICEVTLDADDTEDLAGRYYHEAQVTDSASDIATVLVGYATIKETLIDPVSP